MSMFYRLLQNMSSDADLYDQLKDIRIETPQEYQDFVSGRIEPVYPVASVYGPYKAGKYLVDLLRKNLFKKGAKPTPPTTAITTVAKEIESRETPLLEDFSMLDDFYYPPLLDHPFAFDSYEDDKATMGFQDESDLAKEAKAKRIADQEKLSKAAFRRLKTKYQDERGFTTTAPREAAWGEPSVFWDSLIDAYAKRLEEGTTFDWEPALSDLEDEFEIETYGANPTPGIIDDLSFRELAERHFLGDSFLSQAPRPAVYEGRGNPFGLDPDFGVDVGEPIPQFGQNPSSWMRVYGEDRILPGSIGVPTGWAANAGGGEGVFLGRDSDWSRNPSEHVNPALWGEGHQPVVYLGDQANPTRFPGTTAGGGVTSSISDDEASGWARFNRPDPEELDKPTDFAFEDVGREMEGDIYREEGEPFPEFGMGEVPASFYAKDVVKRERFNPKVSPGYDVPEGYYSLAAELASGDKEFKDYSKSEQKAIKKEIEFRSLQYPYVEEVLVDEGRDSKMQMLSASDQGVDVEDKRSLRDFLNETPLDFTVITQEDRYADVHADYGEHEENAFVSLIYTGLGPGDRGYIHYAPFKEASPNKLARGLEYPAAFVRYFPNWSANTLTVNEAQIDTRNSSEPFLDKARGGYNRLHEKLAQQTLIDWAKSDKEQLMIPLGEYHFTKNHDDRRFRRSIGAYIQNVVGDIEASEHSELIDSFNATGSDIVKNMTDEFYDILNIRDKPSSDGPMDRSKFIKAYEKYSAKWKDILGESIDERGDSNGRRFSWQQHFRPSDFFKSLAGTKEKYTTEDYERIKDSYNGHPAADFHSSRVEYQGKTNHYDRYLKALKHELKKKGWEGELIPVNEFEYHEQENPAEYEGTVKRPTHFLLKATPELKDKILEKGFSITQILDSIKKRQYA